MTEECNHCYHRNGENVDIMQNEIRKYFICCHCGKEKSTSRPYYGGGSTYVDSSEGHGPHKPQTWVFF